MMSAPVFAAHTADISQPRALSAHHGAGPEKRCGSPVSTPALNSSPVRFGEAAMDLARSLPLLSFDFASEADARFEEQYNCFEALAETMRDLAAKPDLSQADLFEKLNPMILEAAAKQPLVAVLCAKYGWSFEDADDLYVHSDTLMELGDQIALAEKRPPVESLADTLSILAANPNLLEGRLCEFVSTLATTCAATHAGAQVALAKMGLAAGNATLWARIEPNRMMLLSGEFARLTLGGQHTPPCTPTRRTSSFSMMSLSESTDMPRSRSTSRPSIASEPVVDRLTDAPNLPLLADLFRPAECERLFVRKLTLCHTLFDFSRPVKLEEKQIKTTLLGELLQHAERNEAIFTEAVQRAIVACLAANCFRGLPPLPEVVDTEPEVEYTEPAWPHLEPVYGLLVLLLCSDVALHADIGITPRFISQLFGLFEARDAREREAVKVIAHRLYSRTLAYRKPLRAALTNAFLRHAYEAPLAFGMLELLELQSAIVDGLHVPLRPENVMLLRRVLLPLHTAPLLEQYHPMLSRCVVKLAQLEGSLVPTIVAGLVKYWPATAGTKAALFAFELEDLLSTCTAADFAPCATTVLRQIHRCLSSPHFHVCMRGLSMLDRPVAQALLADHPSDLVPLLTLVAGHARHHWHQPVLDHARTLMPRLLALRGDSLGDGESMSSSQSSLESAGSSASSGVASGPTPMSVCCTPPEQRIFDFAAL
eukprot:m.228471 g.228471  ORF g.228471 m.228471 type:complete len:709 (-) comp17486_c0_seq1:28-2154(-)